MTTIETARNDTRSLLKRFDEAIEAAEAASPLPSPRPLLPPRVAYPPVVKIGNATVQTKQLLERFDQVIASSPASVHDEFKHGAGGEAAERKPEVVPWGGLKHVRDLEVEGDEWLGRSARRRGNGRQPPPKAAGAWGAAGLQGAANRKAPGAPAWEFKNPKTPPKEGADQAAAAATPHREPPGGGNTAELASPGGMGTGAAALPASDDPERPVSPLGGWTFTGVIEDGRGGRGGGGQGVNGAQPRGGVGWGGGNGKEEAGVGDTTAPASAAASQPSPPGGGSPAAEAESPLELADAAGSGGAQAAPADGSAQEGGGGKDTSEASPIPAEHSPPGSALNLSHHLIRLRSCDTEQSNLSEQSQAEHSSGSLLGPGPVSPTGPARVSPAIAVDKLVWEPGGHSSRGGDSAVAAGGGSPTGGGGGSPTGGGGGGSSGNEGSDEVAVKEGRSPLGSVRSAPVKGGQSPIGSVNSAPTRGPSASGQGGLLSGTSSAESGEGRVRSSPIGARTESFSGRSIKFGMAASIRMQMKGRSRLGTLVTAKSMSYSFVSAVTEGIRTAIDRQRNETLQMRGDLPGDYYTETTKDQFQQEGGGLYKFKDYAPAVFRHLRHLFGVNDDDYLASVGTQDGISEIHTSETGSKSGQTFLISRDGRYFMKTTTKAEARFFIKRLPDYYRHMREHRNSFLCRFFGVHRIKPGKMHLLIMSNIFDTERVIHQRFDLKGSRVGRMVTEQEREKPTVILKDIDFERERGKAKPVQIGADRKPKLMEQLRTDAAFLQRLHVMDYSLLLGIHQRDSFKLQRGSSCPSKKLAKGINMKGMTKSDLLQKTGSLLALRPEATHTSQFQEHDGGWSSQASQNGRTVTGDEIYFLGIIDWLQYYNVRKRSETLYKGLKGPVADISAVPPAMYAERFCNFIDAHIC